MKNLEYIVFLAKAGIQQLLFYIFYLQSFTRITTVKLLATLGDGKTDMVSAKVIYRRTYLLVGEDVGGGLKSAYVAYSTSS